MSEQNAGYAMLPWLRRGLSTLQGTVLEGERLKATVAVSVTRRVTGSAANEVPAESISKEVLLYGPGDVLGFNPNVVARLEPKANIGDFEPNYFPFIEFSEADFPWRFSTKVEGTGTDTTVWPWLTLIVLEREAMSYVVRSEDTWEGIAQSLYGTDTVAESLEIALGNPTLTAGFRLKSLPRNLTDPAGATWSIRLQQVTVGAEFTPGPTPMPTNGDNDDNTAKQPTLPPSITVSPALLPDLAEAWRWAHVQVSNPFYTVQSGDTWERIATALYGSAAAAAELESALDHPVLATDQRLSGLPKTLRNSDGTAPWDLRLQNLSEVVRKQRELAASRLLCARRLQPGKRYQAFVVPTFKLGALAGLGEPFDGTSGGAFAWEPDDTDDVSLPYYFTWEFGTGLQGDFEYLVRLLEPRVLEGLGLREVECRSPGFGCAGVSRTLADETTSHTLSVEGALQSLDTEYTRWGKDLPGGSTAQTQRDLAELINRPDAAMAASSNQPREVAPPIYGRWHAARSSVAPEGTAWIDELNLDPRHRMAAGLGAIAIEREQEPLMASAWKQLGPIEEANKLLRQAQFGREASLETYRRLQALPTGSLLRIAQPLATRVPAPAMDGEPPATIRERIRRSPIPLAAVAPTFRRIARGRGSLRRRQQSVPKGKYRDLLERLNDGEIAAAGAAPKPDGMPGLCDITMTMLACSGMFKWAKACCGKGASAKEREWLAKKFNLFCEENIDCEQLFAILASEFKRAGKDYEKDRIRDLGVRVAAFCGVLEDLGRLPGDSVPPRPIDLEGLRRAVLDRVDPRKSIVERVWSRIHLSGSIQRRGDPLDRIMAAPDFPQPMYEPLAEMSQDHILPGLATVPQNTIGLVETNGRYIESYMVACSHEMARELLWREYPTDQRGTYFRQFWDVSNSIPSLEEEGAVRRSVERDLPEAAAKDIDAEIRKRLTESRKDIKPIHQWVSRLGGNGARPSENTSEENLVLLIRGDLLKKYPNTVIYAVKARSMNWQGKPRRFPELPEYNDLIDKLNEGSEGPQKMAHVTDAGRKNPIFGALLAPDVTALGFALTEMDVRSNGDYPGYYFVLEERASESRFCIDEGPISKIGAGPDAWNALTWSHFFPDVDTIGNGYINGLAPEAPNATSERTDEWNQSAATIADITLQRPVRIAVHADKMIPKTDS